MGIQRAECIVDACMLKVATPVGARRRSGEGFCSDAVSSANFREAYEVRFYSAYGTLNHQF